MKLLTILFIWTLSTFSTKGGETIKYYNESNHANNDNKQESYSVQKKEYSNIPSFSFPVPEVVFLPHQDLQNLYEQMTLTKSNGRLYGFTPIDKSFPIFISKNVEDLSNPFHASIIVHEMVHYIQRENNVLSYDTSPNEQHRLEQQAKRIQCFFLEQHGVLRQDIENIVKC